MDYYFSKKKAKKYTNMSCWKNNLMWCSCWSFKMILASSVASLPSRKAILTTYSILHMYLLLFLVLLYPLKVKYFKAKIFSMWVPSDSHKQSLKVWSFNQQHQPLSWKLQLLGYPRPTDPGTRGVGPGICMLGGAATPGVWSTDLGYIESPKMSQRVNFYIPGWKRWKHLLMFKQSYEIEANILFDLVLWIMNLLTSTKLSISTLWSFFSW